MKKLIPFIDLKSQYKSLELEIKSRINKVLDHGQYILGPEVFELESRLADFVGVKHCVSASSGSDTLMIAMLALGIGPGDEVITTPFTYIATSEMIAILGAKPVFVDIDSRTYNIDPSKISKAVTVNTKAILAVSLFGQCADFDAINKIADEYNLPVIEDAAQSFGATYKKRKSCGLSTIGSTSFFPSKPLGAYGDGGALFTNDDSLAKLMREIRVHGQDKRYSHVRIGINGRLDTIQAAVLLAKLDNFEWEVLQRENLGRTYSKIIESLNINNSVILPYIEPFNTSVYAQYTIQVDKRELVQKSLTDAGIPSAVHYPIPLHLQSAFSYLQVNKDALPISENASQRVLSLPMGAYLDDDTQLTICNALSKAIT